MPESHQDFSPPSRGNGGISKACLSSFHLHPSTSLANAASASSTASAEELRPLSFDWYDPLPQPLSRFQPNLGVIMGGGGIPHTPEMALAVVGVISFWSAIEYNYGSLLANIASADPIAVNAVFQAMISGDARRAALISAAKAKLSPEQSSLILAVTEATKASRETRNDFSHHLWGSLQGRPDCALLMNAKTLARYNAELAEWATGPLAEIRNDPAPTFDKSDIMVWRQSDFDSALESARIAHRRTVELVYTFEHPAAEHRRRALLEDPHIARLYDRHLQESRPQPAR